MKRNFSSLYFNIYSNRLLTTDFIFICVCKLEEIARLKRGKRGTIFIVGIICTVPAAGGAIHM